MRNENLDFGVLEFSILIFNFLGHCCTAQDLPYFAMKLDINILDINNPFFRDSFFWSLYNIVVITVNINFFASILSGAGQEPCGEKPGQIEQNYSNRGTVPGGKCSLVIKIIAQQIILSKVIKLQIQKSWILELNEKF